MLDLRLTHVTDAGLAGHSLLLRALTNMFLLRTKVTEDGVARLKELRPGLRGSMNRNDG